MTPPLPLHEAATRLDRAVAQFRGDNMSHIGARPGRERHIHRVAALVFALAVLIVATRGTAAPITLTFRPVLDNTLYQDSLGALSNGRGVYCFAGRTSGASTRRALFAFDLSGIPVSATVTSATLRLTLDRASGFSGTRPTTLHRAMASWGEGTSAYMDPFFGGGMGAPATPGDATWLFRFYPGSPWATAGGDFVAASSATTDVSETLGAYVWGSTAAMVADVQQWVSTPAENFGWVLLGDETVVSTARRFFTREAVDPATQPILTVVFSSATDTPSPEPPPLVFAPAWPNPFNPTTTLYWELPVAGRALVTVYNAHGERIATLMDGVQSAGPHSRTWDARDVRGNSLPSGVYVVQVEEGRASVTQRIVLVR